MIKALHNLDYSLRRIAREVNCSPSTVMYELKRGTLEKTSTKGRPSVYSPSRGQKKYEENRQTCHRKYVSHADNPCIILIKADTFISIIHRVYRTIYKEKRLRLGRENEYHIGVCFGECGEGNHIRITDWW